MAYVIYYMEVSEIKDVDTFLQALNNIESLAHYKTADPWTIEDLSKRYVCVEVRDYKIRGCNRVNELKAAMVTYTPYDPNKLEDFIAVLKFKELVENVV